MDDKEQNLLNEMHYLKAVIDYYLAHKFDDEAHMLLNDHLVDTQRAMKMYFDDVEFVPQITIIKRKIE